MSFSFLHSLSVTRSQKMCASFTPVSQWGQYTSAPGAWSYELLFFLSQKMVPSLRTLPQRSKGMGDVCFSPLPACQCTVLLPVRRASPSVERARRDAARRDAVSSHPRAGGVSALAPPVDLVVQPCQSARQHVLCRASAWRDLSFSWAPGKAGGRQWLLAWLCWSSQRIPQAAQPNTPFGLRYDELSKNTNQQ